WHRIHVLGRLAQRCSRFLISDCPQPGEHRGRSARPSHRDPHLLRELAGLADQHHNWGERIGDPGNIRKLAILPRQTLLKGRLGETSKAVAFGILGGTIAGAAPRSVDEPEAEWRIEYAA